MLKARYNRSEPLFAMIVHDLFELSCEMNKSSVVEILTKDINGNPVWLSRNINDYEDYVDSGYFNDRPLINTIVKIPAAEIK